MILPFPTAPSVEQSFRLQNTIAKSVSLTGFGFWTGEDITVLFRPGTKNSGIVFVRSDLDNMPQIPALVEFREEKPRQTSLVNGDARVDMVEHLLAAVKALQIDNLEIWVNNAEMPGLDGSSRLFFEALASAGIVKQPAIRPIRVVTQAFRVGTDTHYITVSPNPKGLNSYRYSIVPEDGYPVGAQDFQFDFSTEAFQKKVVASRTFLAKHEADYLLARGLCQRVTPQDVLVLTKEGPLGNEYRYEDECARHKVLDMIGDFSLTDCDLVGTVESYRGGHSLNAECLREIEMQTMFLDETYLSRHNVLFRSEEERLKVA
jgi:UDP-3-O-[3-hydroxymyristoyl] N-acetylglucosamine deacetylase/UDP-3-O-[3-hydroxymyristoyl] N-acetylglucosamine deacetylase/3-hydroxyacyl-[acyl-carrier-protein] dehydratase